MCIQKCHLHCQQEKARHELSVSKDYDNIMPYILQETPANFICISMHFSSFVCIKNRTKWIASKKRNRINNRYVFCCNKRWRHLSVPFCGLKNKSKPRWCLAVSTVFNKRSFTTILRIVMVIYPYTLDPLKKYRKPEWLDDLFTPHFVHHNRHLRSIFGYLKINKKIFIQNWCVIPVYLHIIDITWHFGVFDLRM